MRKVNFDILGKNGKEGTGDKLKDRYILIVTKDRGKLELAQFQRDVYGAVEEILGTDSESDTLTYALAVTAKVAEIVEAGTGIGYKGLIETLTNALAGPGTVEETKCGRKVKAANPDKKKELVAV